MDEGYQDDSWSADLDQALASARDIAPILAGMYRELLAQGLSKAEATNLAAAWISALDREAG